MIQENFKFYKPCELLRPYVRYYWVFKSDQAMNTYTFKTGGVDGCDCKEILRLIEQGKIDTTPLITHRFSLSKIEEAYRVFENKLDGVIKVAIVK